MAKITTEEAFVKVLQMHGIQHSFGIIGSAFMPISDLFPKAGIKFWDVAHESNGGLIADGYTRSTGKISMCIAQNGPGITGLVTPIKTAYWNHTPMLLVTPQAANKTIGQGGFQEVEQMNLFKDMVCYQEEVRDPSRMAEVLNRVIEKAIRGSAPAQINVPRDYWTQVIDIELPSIIRMERQSGGVDAIKKAAEILSNAKFPVILSGAGVVLADAIDDCKNIAEKLDAPVACGYQHNDSFPGKHPLAVGPLGYNGSKAAMEIISKADVVLALGTRLNPFSTLPGYGIDYWPKEAEIIQVDMNSDRIGLAKKISVGICGDAKLVAQQILSQLSSNAGDIGREDRKALIHQTKSSWLQTLTSLDHEEDDEGTSWNKDSRERDPDRMSPRMAWRAIQAGLPEDAIISSDIGNNCAIGNAYPTFEKGRKYLAPGLFGPCGYGFPSVLGAKIGCPDTPVVGFSGDGAFGISMSEMTSCNREEWPDITMVIFRNFQWGAEKRNTTLWYDNNFIGTELDPKLSYAKIAEACGFKGVKVTNQS
ncbi:MAG: sulfoacetaldehyde acetyltransferase, partial [Pelagibacteraceae bacterium]|nr:sulfoacetaldehyde acetyltransferase [Pelagibacteraceae bacterium]